VGPTLGGATSGLSKRAEDLLEFQFLQGSDSDAFCECWAILFVDDAYRNLVLPSDQTERRVIVGRVMLWPYLNGLSGIFLPSVMESWTRIEHMYQREASVSDFFSDEMC